MYVPVHLQFLMHFAISLDSLHSQVVPVDHHLRNTLAWKSLCSELSRSEGMPRVEGFILTGWQRFDHFAGLCELLPAASPSLHCCLEALTSISRGRLRCIDRSV